MIEDMKRDRRWWILAGCWLLMVAFVPMAPSFTEGGINWTRPLRDWYVYIPYMWLAMLAYCEWRPETRLKAVLTVRNGTRACVAFIAFAVAVSIADNVQSWPQLVWNELSTPITATVLILLMMRRLRHMGEFRAVLLAFMAGIFLIGFFEFPYHIVGKLWPNGWWQTTWENVFHVLVKPFFLVLPFTLCMFYYRIRPTIATVVLLEWVIHQPINWVVYQFVKSLKLVLIPIIYSLQAYKCKYARAFVGGEVT